MGKEKKALKILGKTSHYQKWDRVLKDPFIIITDEVHSNWN